MPDEEIREENQQQVQQDQGAEEEQQPAAEEQEAADNQQMQPVGVDGGQNEGQEGEAEAVEEEEEVEGEEIAEQAEGAGGAPAGGDDQQEQQEEQADDQQILEEAQQEGGGNQKQEQELAQDDVNQDIMDAAREAGVAGAQPQEEGDPNRAFDTLEDLKRLNAEQNQAGANGAKAGELQLLRENVMKFRRGNIYKAVICAKMLENGEQPGNANKELNKPRPGQTNRFSRFVNSSSIVNSTKLDKAGKVMKIANATSGLLGMASSTYKNSRLSGLVTLASDVMILVNSVRNILKKLANFKKTNTTVRKKAFGVISIVSDFCMAVSKGAAIAKVIAGKIGHGNGLFTKIMTHLSNFAVMAGQLTGLAGVINTMQEIDANKRQLKKDQKEEEVRVEEILNRLEPGENQENAGQENNEGGENAAQENAQAQPRRRRRLDLRRKKHLKEKIYRAMERPELTADDKAVLASYLGRERTIAKRKLTLANLTHGLISLVLGLGASASKTAMGLSDKGSEDFMRSAQSATILGGAANSSILLFGMGDHIGKTATDAGRNEGEVSFVRDAFWGTLHNMAGDERYGLRRVASRLTPEAPGNEAIDGARVALEKYGTVTKQLTGSGVNFPKLFEANDVEAFKDALAAGL